MLTRTVELAIQKQLKAVGLSVARVRQTKFGNYNVDCPDGTRMAFTAAGYIRRRNLGPCGYGNFGDRYQWVIKSGLTADQMVSWIENHPMAFFGRKNHVAVKITK